MCTLSAFALPLGMLGLRASLVTCGSWVFQDLPDLEDVEDMGASLAEGSAASGSRLVLRFNHQLRGCLARVFYCSLVVNALHIITQSIYLSMVHFHLMNLRDDSCGYWEGKEKAEAGRSHWTRHPGEFSTTDPSLPPRASRGAQGCQDLGSKGEGGITGH